MKNLGLALCEALVSGARGILHHEIMHTLTEAEHAGLTHIVKFRPEIYNTAADVIVNDKLRGFYT